MKLEGKIVGIGPVFETDEEGFPEVSERCMDCEESYVDDIFYEWMCRARECPFYEEQRRRQT